MGQYSIKELEQLSGIKAHTLRIWEKRYQLLTPSRTDTNIRYYTDEDLKLLLNVSLLSNHGIKISKIVSMSNNQFMDALKKIDDKSIKNEQRVGDLIIPMINFDEASIDVLFNKSVNEIGLEKTFTDVIYPFLQKVGRLWLTNEVGPTQEHFMSNIIRQKLCSAINNLPNPSGKAKKVILFLPEGEYHELGLLFFYFLYKKRGARVYYFGQSVPIKEVEYAAKEINPNWVLTYSVILSENKLQELIDDMSTFETEKVFFLDNREEGLPSVTFSDQVKKINLFHEALDLVDQNH